jgi:hypothetical protein
LTVKYKIAIIAIMEELVKYKDNCIKSKIMVIRNKQVILDRDLSELYEVETKYLNRQVKRNIGRFPEEFMFRLNETEKNELVTKWHRFNSLKHSKFMPYAFTEYGIAMLSSILNNEKAIFINIEIIRAFINFKKTISSNLKIQQKLQELESKYNEHDKEISVIFEAIKQLMEPPISENKKKIGFIRTES